MGNHISLTTQSKIYASSGHVNNKTLAPNILSTGSMNVGKVSKFSISCHSITVNSNKHVICFIRHYDLPPDNALYSSHYLTLVN